MIWASLNTFIAAIRTERNLVLNCAPQGLRTRTEPRAAERFDGPCPHNRGAVQQAIL